MKTAFNLIPVSDKPNELHLIVEVGWYGVSYIWYRKDPLTLEGVLCYNFNERTTSTEVAANLEYIHEQEAFFSSVFNTITVLYNFRESLLIPASFYNDMYNSEQLTLMYGTAVSSIMRVDDIAFSTGMGTTEMIYNVYRIPQEVHSVITAKYPGSRMEHSTSRQLLHESRADIHCIIYHNTIKVILFKGKSLQLVQQFQYKAPEDVSYHLLNVCDKHGIDIQNAVLLLSGMIDVESNLYQEIYKYFLNVTLEEIPDEVFLAPHIKAFPTHYFSHLTALVK